MQPTRWAAITAAEIVILDTLLPRTPGALRQDLFRGPPPSPVERVSSNDHTRRCTNTAACDRSRLSSAHQWPPTRTRSGAHVLQCGRPAGGVTWYRWGLPGRGGVGGGGGGGGDYQPTWKVEWSSDEISNGFPVDVTSIIRLFIHLWVSLHPPTHHLSTHPRTHAPTHPRTHAPTHPPTHAPIHPLIQPFNHSTIQPSNHPTIQPFNHSTIQPSNHSTIQPSNHPFIHPPNQPPSHPTTQPPNHPTTQPPNHPTT